MRKNILKRAKSSTAPIHYPFSDKFQPLYLIPEKIQGMSRCVTEEPYRQPDTGGDKLLMDHGLQRDWAGKGSKDPKSGKDMGYTAPHSTASVDAGSCMTRFPKPGSSQLHCRLSLQALLSRDFLCPEIRL